MVMMNITHLQTWKYMEIYEHDHEHILTSLNSPQMLRVVSPSTCLFAQVSEELYDSAGVEETLEVRSFGKQLSIE